MTVIFVFVLRWHSRGLDVCDFLHVDAGSGILPHRPWFLQRVCNVCGHTVPMLLWVSLSSYRSPADLLSSYCFTNTHTTVASCGFFCLQCSDSFSLCLISPLYLIFKHSLYFMFSFPPNFPLTRSKTLNKHWHKRWGLGKKWRLIWQALLHEPWAARDPLKNKKGGGRR